MFWVSMQSSDEAVLLEVLVELGDGLRDVGESEGKLYGVCKLELCSPGTKSILSVRAVCDIIGLVTNHTNQPGLACLPRPQRNRRLSFL
jgi:hypothetical protein